MTEIQFKGTITLEDKQAREMISTLETKISTINERTKSHTLYIKQLEKELKKLKEDKGK